MVSYFRFIWIPMLWVYGHYKYFYSYSAGINYSRPNLTSKVDPRAVMVKPLSHCPKFDSRGLVAVKGLKRWIFQWKPWRPKCFFPICYHHNCLRSFWFIWIPVLWAYGHYKYFYSYSAGIDFILQTSDSDTKVDPRAVMVKPLSHTPSLTHEELWRVTTRELSRKTRTPVFACWEISRH